jgi:FkbM family methyltransferase
MKSQMREKIKSLASKNLPHLHECQPLRDQCVGIVAQEIGKKYADQLIIDIGANIGDTAAIIASKASNPLLLIEASDFFYSYLVKNAAKLNNKIVTHKILIGTGEYTSGELFHWGGTAEWKEDTSTTPVHTEKIHNMTKESVCFIKSDTDGYDFKILLASLPWLAIQKPALLIESQIREQKDFDTQVRLLDELSNIGYDNFIVWDDTGNHLLSTNESQVISDISRQKLNSSLNGGLKISSNFDICCFHIQDIDVYQTVTNYYRSHN